MFLINFMAWFADAKPGVASKYRFAEAHCAAIPSFGKRSDNEFTAVTKVFTRLFGCTETHRTILIAELGKRGAKSVHRLSRGEGGGRASGHT
jgi:hypothetical protein